MSQQAEDVTIDALATFRLHAMFSFLPDPGVPGVRSMGPGLSNY